MWTMKTLLCLCIYHHSSLINTSRPKKIAAISQMKWFWNEFSLMKIYEFCFRFHCSLFLRFELIIFQYWFRWLSEPMMIGLLTNICTTRPQWLMWFVCIAHILHTTARALEQTNILQNHLTNYNEPWTLCKPLHMYGKYGIKELI